MADSTNTNQRHKVFVYGTLKKGEPNHQWFSHDNKGYYKFLYEAKTKDKYPLIIATEYNIPFLLYSPGLYSKYFGYPNSIFISNFYISTYFKMGIIILHAYIGKR